MMISNSHFLFRRWTIFAPGVICSLLPALLLTATFTDVGRYGTILPAFWVELLIGPVKYWATILQGDSIGNTLHPMSGNSLWVYLVCFILALAHPIKPRPCTAWISAGGFIIWYVFAFLTIASYEY